MNARQVYQALRPLIDELALRIARATTPPTPGVNSRVIANGTVSVPANGTALAGPFTLNANEVPTVCWHPLFFGSGQSQVSIWGVRPFGQAMQLFMLSENVANQFSIGFDSNVGVAIDVQWLILGVTP